MKNILIVVLLIAVIGLGYLQLKPKLAPLISPQTAAAPSAQLAPVNTTPSAPVVPPQAQSTATSTIQGSTVTKTEWGVSFKESPGWSVSTDTGTQMKLISGAEKAVPGEGDTITIDYVTGNSITSADAKFGEITYFYDNANGWMETDNIEDEGVTPHSTPTFATMQFYTDGALPVFKGTGRWATYIVPLSHTTFLKLNIGGGGLTQPLTDLVKTIVKTQPSGR